jgi:NitT/TauT family transport system substrate-binding protein
MKKLVSFIVAFMLVFTLSACTDKNSGKETEEPLVKDPIDLKIMAPIGTPALAQTYMEKTMPSLGGHVTYEIETVSGADPLVAAFASGSHDIIYAPTNLGAKLISTGLDYKFAGTVVWGNLYIASTGYETFTLDDLDGKEIIAFGQNSTPDIVLQAVIAGHTFTTAPTITYVDSVSQAQAEILTDNSKIILMAEPALSVLGLPSKIGDALDVINLQVEWASLTGDSSYPQAGIFVKSELDTDVVDAYLAAVAVSVQKANSETVSIAQMAVDLEYGFPLGVLVSAIPRANLEYKSATDSKAALELYFGYIIEMNSALIGGSLPTEDFYYTGQ